MSQASETNSNDNVISLPDLPGIQQPAPPALPVPVHHGHLLLTGWAIKTDTVLVMASGLTEHTEVTINDERIKVENIFEITRGLEGWEPLSALQLPLGTLEVSGEAFPPGIKPPELPGHPAVYAFWCRLFPWIRGC